MFSFTLSDVARNCSCTCIAIFLLVVPAAQSVAQTPQADDSVPKVGIFHSGSYIITEGEDAVFVLTAEPAPAADLTVNLKISQYNVPLSLPLDENFLATETLQATIDVSGEAFFIVPTEDDNEDEPLTGIDISIEPGEGYELRQACTPNGQCSFTQNVYDDELSLMNPDSAGVTVLDNDGPQAKNGEIALASSNILHRVETGAPTTADISELAALAEDSAAAANDMSWGGTTQNEALLLLTSSRMQIEISERIAVAGFAVREEVVSSIVRNAALSVLLYRRYPPSHRLFVVNTGLSAELEVEIRDFFAGSRNLIPPWSEILGEDSVIGSVRSLLDEIGELVHVSYGSILNENALGDSQAISLAAQEALSKLVASKLGLVVTSPNDSSIDLPLHSNTRLLRNLVDATGVELTSYGLRKLKRPRFDGMVGGGIGPIHALVPFLPSVIWSLELAGLDEPEAEALAKDLSGFIIPDQVGIQTAVSSTDQFVYVSRIIDEALESETEIDYIDELLYTAISAGEGTYSVQAASVKVVSAVIPEGLFPLDDGSALIVSRGLAIHLVPASLDLVSFAGRANAFGYTVRATKDGGIVLTGNGATISGSFSYSSAPINTSLDIGTANRYLCTPSTCLGAPAGQNPANSDYYFTVGYWGTSGASGLEQRLLPYFASDGLYDYLASLGLSVTTDRFETGVITIDGVGRFKPGYEVEGILQDGAPGDSTSPILEETDANGDGVMDYRITIGTATQMLYGVP